MASIGRPSCEEGIFRASRTSAPCTPASVPWVLAATILPSTMAFIDGTVTNVALFFDTSHPIVASFEPGEHWRWSYADETTI